MNTQPKTASGLVKLLLFLGGWVFLLAAGCGAVFGTVCNQAVNWDVIVCYLLAGTLMLCGQVFIMENK